MLKVNNMYKKSFYIVACILLLQFVVSGCIKKIDKSKFNFERDRKYKDYSYGMITGIKPIVWGTNESTKMIKETKYSKSFFTLLPHYAGQRYLSTCGPATARIILSAIYEKTGTPFPIEYEFSNVEEENGVTMGKFFLSERAAIDIYHGDDERIDYDVIARLKKIKSGKYSGAISIARLTEVLNTHPHVKAEFFTVEAKNDPKIEITKFRELVKKITSSDDKYMIINYHFGAFYPYTSGHYSPLVAYHEKTDRVLIMDVASHLGTWVWITIEELYKSMSSVISGCQRGYIVVEQVDKKVEDGQENKS